MQVDHIIIFSKNEGSEADELVQCRLLEGSNRIHPGQGTRNRKFYFKNFFLEIVWVSNEDEITSQLIAPTRLWERANHQKTGASPFGLCLENTDDISNLFEGCIRYQPSYLSDGLSFDIITNEVNSYLPWTCRLPHASSQNYVNEPTDHPMGIQFLTRVKFGIKQINNQSRFLKFFSNISLLEFERSDDHYLTLQFDNNKAGRTATFTSIPLTIAY